MFDETDRPLWVIPLLRVIAHDLRTPLNVLGLRLQLVTEASQSETVREEVELAELGIQQMSRVLGLIADFSRVYDLSTARTPVAIEPSSWLRKLALPSAGGSFSLETDDTCPETVALDESLGTLCVRLAIDNAVAAAAEGDRLILSATGSSDRWRIAISSGRSATSSTQRHELVFNSIPTAVLGSTQDRFGLDLLVVSMALERLGGTGWTISEGEGRRLELEIPQRPPDSKR